MSSEILKQYSFDRVSHGYSYKGKMTDGGRNIYVTVNHDDDGNPFEVFVRYDVAEHFELIVGLTRRISKDLQDGIPLGLIAEELKKSVSPRTGHFIPGGDWCPSLTARIGYMLGVHLEYLKKQEAA